MYLVLLFFFPKQKWINILFCRRFNLILFEHIPIWNNIKNANQISAVVLVSRVSKIWTIWKNFYMNTLPIYDINTFEACKAHHFSESGRVVFGVASQTIEMHLYVANIIWSNKWPRNLGGRWILVEIFGARTHSRDPTLQMNSFDDKFRSKRYQPKLRCTPEEKNKVTLVGQQIEVLSR